MASRSKKPARRAASRKLRRVLVATDFRAGSAFAYSRVSALPLSSRAEVLLVGVRPVKRSQGRRTLRRWRENLARAALRLESQLAGTHPRVRIEPVLLAGRAAPQINALAQDREVDLIVMGRHSRRPLADLLGIGGTAQKVMRRSDVPVLVARRQERGPYRRPLLGYELPPGPATLRAIREARPMVSLKARWTAVHVVDDLAGALRTVHVSERHIASVRERQERELGRAVRHDLGKRAARVSWKVEIRFGDPATRLARAAEERKADLVVVGTHAHSDLGARILGSVAEAVLQRAPCDVLAVPPPITGR